MKLFVKERREEILKLLTLNKRVTVKELSKNIGVSEATLRSDLNEMEVDGLLIRTHGGALLKEVKNDNTSFSAREKRNKSEKHLIAKAAFSLIQNKQSILLDASSTAMELAKILKDSTMRITVVTSGIQTALELKENPNLTVIVIGGVVTQGSSSIEGNLGIDILNHINIDLMFTSAGGFSLEEGLTDFNLYEVQLKRELIQRAPRVVTLIDSTKIGVNSSAVFAHLNQIDTIITDTKVNKGYELSLNDHNINLIIAE